MTYFPLLPGCQPLPRMHIPPLHSSLSPISGVPPLTSGRRLTSGRLASPAFRGARPCLACTSHLWHSSLSPISRVHHHTFTKHLTSVTTCFPLLPGCHSLPHISISPRKRLLSPAFRGAPLRHTDLGHLSLRNYFYGAENAQDFLRRRRCGVQNCLKKRDKAEKVPIAYRNRDFFLYIFSSFLHETSFSFFERKSCILLRRNSFCKGKMPKILRDNLLRTFLCTFSAALAFEWIDRRKVVF